MRENTGQCIVNCLKCRRGNHPLFRNFGLNVTDLPYKLRRGQIQEQISMFYPDVTDVSITQKGENSYDVNIKAVSNETE